MEEKEKEMSENTSLFKRFWRLFRSRANKQLDKMETPEDLSRAAMEAHTKKVDDFKASLTESIANLRVQQAQNAKNQQEYDELGDKAKAAARKIQELQAAENPNQDEIARYTRYAEALLTQREGLKQAILTAKPILDAMEARVEEMKKQFNDIENETERIRNDQKALLLRASTAEGVKKAAEISSAMDRSFETGGINRALRDKVDQVEGLAAATLELTAESAASQQRRIEREISRSTVSRDVAALLESGDLPDGIADARQITAS